jgi:hypothetical protein
MDNKKHQKHYILLKIVNLTSKIDRTVLVFCGGGCPVFVGNSFPIYKN